MITVITRQQCPRCDIAKSILKNHNVQYTELVIDENITREYVLNKYPGRKQLPIIDDPLQQCEENYNLQYLRQFVF